MEAQPKPNDARALLVIGVVLLIVGAGALVAQFTPELARYLPLAMGLVLLALFAAVRSYVALVFAAILTGLGGGLVAADLAAAAGEVEGGLIVLGLGLGFFSIWLVSDFLRMKESHFWPVIPGTILSLIGLGLLVNAFDEPLVGPTIMLVAGVVLITLALVRSRITHRPI